MKVLLQLVLITLFVNYLLPGQTLVYPDIPNDFINYLAFTSSSIGFFVNAGGDLLQTTNGGETWTTKYFIPDQSIKEVKFIDSLTGFAFSDKMVSEPGDISLIYTLDGGETWENSPISLFGSTTFLPVSLTHIIKANSNGIETLSNFFNNWDTTYTIPTFKVYEDSTFIWYEKYGDIYQFQKLENGNILALGNSYLARDYGIISDSVTFILQSSNSGETWDTLWCDLPILMNTISFADSQIGWMAGEYQKIYKTTNGGITWNLQYSPSSSYGPINYIFALDELNIFAVACSTLVISNDGGNSWNNLHFNYYGDYKVYFKNNMNGYLYGEDFYKTVDGGHTWSRVSHSIKDNISNIYFINTKMGWAAGYGTVYKTTDGGYSWKSQISYSPVLNYKVGLNFIDTSNGFLVTYYNAYKTTNGGTTWDILHLTNNNKIFYPGEVKFYNHNLGIIANEAEESVPGSHNYDVPSVFVTTDKGENWQRIIYPAGSYYNQFKKMVFVSPDSLWGITATGIWLSNDTAKTWQPIYSTSYFLGSYSFDFIDPYHGCFSDAGYEINYTSDAGQTWQNLDLSKYIWPNDYKIIGQDVSRNFRIFGVGDKGRIVKYTVNGISHNQYLPSYTGKNMNAISLYMDGQFPNLWFAGDGFTIIHRTSELVFGIDKKDDGKITGYELLQNYPNPFNPVTTIKYAIPKMSNVTIKVYDILGRKVATLVNEKKLPGIYEVKFNGKDLSSGVYFFRIKAGDFVGTKKMLLLK